MSSSKWFKAALSVLGVLAVVAYATPAAAQQTGTVTGVVTETGTGRPLQGVQVFVSGRGPTATTDAEGRFTLRNVPTGQTQVRARLVGYTSQSATMAIVAGQSSEVNFEMRASVISLDEIVVTGAGVAQSKKQLGNTVATVNPSELVQTAPVQTFSETLAAREPGISVKPSGGIAGESARIEIRGVSSLSMRNIPVVYVDGVRIDNGRSMYIAASGGGGRARAFDNINPEAIERIEVLKGAAAATLYGSEANAGVIQIFTKKGSAGAPRFNFNMQQGFSQVDKGRIKPNTGFARTATQLTNMREIFNAPNLQLYETLEATTLPDLYGTGYNSAYSGDVAGGSDDFQYFVAGRYTWDDGPMLETLGPGGRDQVRRIQGSAQFTMFPRDRLSFRLSTQFTDMHQNSPPNNNNIYGYISTAIMGKPERANCDESGYVDAYGECSGAGNPYGSAAFNTIREAAQRFIEGDMEHFNTSATITYEATEGLNLDMTFGLDATNQVNFDFTPFGNDVDKVSGRIPTGERWAGNMNNREITIDTRGTWTRRFGNISSQFVAGLQTNLSNNRRRFGFGEDFPGPGLEVVSAAATTDGNEATTETANIGVLLQEQIGFNDWIYVTLGGRWDRNSAFGDSTSGAFYPKVSASIIPSDNGTWSNQTFSSLRLRAAFGKSGQQPSGFAKFTTFSSLSSPDGGGIAPSNLGNVNLKPETAVEWEVGGEVGLFNDQASVDLTYWNRQTQDALVALQFPVSGGFLSPQLDNIGLLSASGLEIKLQARMLDQENLALDVFANGAYLHEEIRDMGGAPPIKTGGSYPRYRNFLMGPEAIDVDCSFAPSGAICRDRTIYYAPGAHLGARLIPECSAGQVYLAGTNAGSGRTCWTRGSTLPFDTNRDGNPDTQAEFLSWIAANKVDGLGDWQFYGFDQSVFTSRLLMDDEDGDGDVLDNFLGKPTPDWAGAFGFNLTLQQNLQINTLFEYKTGNFYVNNLTDAFRNSHPAIGRNTPRPAALEAIWANPASTDADKMAAALEYVENYKALAPNSGLNTIKNANFVRFRELGITYTAPADLASKFGFNNLSFNLSGRNLALWTPYDGQDPELNADTADDFLQSVEAFGSPIPRRFTFSVRFGF